MAGLLRRNYEERIAAEQERNAKLKLERTTKFYEAWSTKMLNLGKSAASTYSWANGKLTYHHGAGVNFIDSNLDGLYTKGEKKIEGKVEEVALWNQFQAEAKKAGVPIDLQQFQGMWQDYVGLKTKLWNESVQFAMASGAPMEEFQRVNGEDPRAMQDVLAATSNPALLGIDVSTEAGAKQLTDLNSFLMPDPNKLSGRRFQDDPMGWYNRMMEANPFLTSAGTVGAGYIGYKGIPKLAKGMKGFTPGLFTSLAARQAGQLLGGAAGLSDQQARIAGDVAGLGTAGYGIKKGLANSPEITKIRSDFKTKAGNALSKGSKADIIKNAKALGVDDDIIKKGSRVNASKVNINKVKAGIVSKVKTTNSARILKMAGNTTKKNVVRALPSTLAKTAAKKLTLRAGMSAIPGGAIAAGAWTLYDIADAAGFIPEKVKFWKNWF